MHRVVVVSFFAALVATGCFDVKPPPKPAKDPTGIIAGKIGVGLVNGSASTDLNAKKRLGAELATARGQPLLGGHGIDVKDTGVRGQPTKQPREFRPGDAIVLFERKAFHKNTILPVLEDMKRDAGGFDDVKIVVDNCKFRVMCKLSLIDSKGYIDEARTSAFVDAMTAQKRRGIRLLVENIRHQGALVPNDPLASLQWHYDAIRLPPAWDITVGDPELVVAVVDSGVKHGNPDLRDKLARDPNNQNQFVEFDFVTGGDLELDDIAGIDLDAEDPGDNLFGADVGEDSYHGTHVAGTIGAETDNRSGVAGILWEAQIVPVRVLGSQLSGNFDDILNGLDWAAGDTDPEFDVGQPVNRRPARLINLSLGAPDTDGRATTVWQAVVDEILDDPDNFFPKDVILVVAAGNAGQDARATTPANIERVITVGATRFDGQRAEYSNFGTPIDVMAPGGESIDQNNDGNPDDILSTWDVDVKLEQGTSMSAPHVTGVAGLIVSAKPNLTHDQVHDIIRTTANQTFKCNEGCGTGLLDAVQALIIAGAELDPAPRLSVDNERLLFPGGISRVTMRVLNLGNVAAPFDLALGAGDADKFSFSPASGTVAAGGSVDIDLDLARGGATDGAVELKITGTGAAAGQEVIVTLLFNDTPARGALQLDTIQVGAFIRDEDGNLASVAQTEAVRATDFVYEIGGLKAGVYEVYAIGDDNHDGIFDSQLESLGAFPNTDAPDSVVVEDNDSRVDDINFNVALRSSFALEGGIGAPCASATSDADCAGIDFGPGGGCITTFTDGYCSRDCSADGLCGVTAVCSRGLECDGQPCDLCLQRCVSDVQCRTGYLCDRFGTCTPEGFTD